MGNADDSRLGNRGMSNRDILELDRTDPFAAALDHIFRTIRDLHVAVGIDGCDIARREPTVAQYVSAFALEIAVRNPPSAHQEVAECDAVPWQLRAGTVDDFHVNAWDGAALLAFDSRNIRCRRVAVFGLELRQRAKRAHLGHAPGMH